jgi:hypothetical protein
MEGKRTMAKTDEKSKEIAVTGDVQEPAPYLPSGELDWAAETRVSDTVAGADLAKDETLDALVGVPFLITRFTFRKGIPKPGLPDAAVIAVEAVIAPENVLRRRRVNMELLPFEPGAQVVFNDGSTGIYRQIVTYLVARGYIEVSDDKPEKGKMGESRYDVHPERFAAIHAGTVTRNEKTGYLDYTVNVRLTCPRGISISDYESEFNPDGARTRYLG